MNAGSDKGASGSDDRQRQISNPVVKKSGEAADIEIVDNTKWNICKAQC